MEKNDDVRKDGKKTEGWRGGEGRKWMEGGGRAFRRQLSGNEDKDRMSLAARTPLALARISAAA